MSQLAPKFRHSSSLKRHPIEAAAVAKFSRRNAKLSVSKVARAAAAAIEVAAIEAAVNIAAAAAVAVNIAAAAAEDMVDEAIDMTRTDRFSPCEPNVCRPLIFDRINLYYTFCVHLHRRIYLKTFFDV